MTPYINKNSGIEAFEHTVNGIRVQFAGGATHEYSSESHGPHHVVQMKRLADVGQGLNTYINKHQLLGGKQ